MGKTILINHSHLGHGDDELGDILMGSFLRKLCVANNKPNRIVLYNSGVKLIADGSPVLDALETLSSQGVDILACGTCLGFYNLLDKIAVGRKSDMQEIAGFLAADEVTTI